MIRSSIAGLAINLIGAPMFSRPNLPAYMALFFMVTIPVTSVAAEAAAPSTPSFQRVDYPTVPAPQAIAIADFNGDGLPDIAIASCIPPGSVSVLLNKGAGSFVPLEVALIPSDRIEGAVQREQPPGGSTKSNLCGLTTGDFNGDRVPDLALANADGTVSILLGKSGGTFGPKTNFPAGTSASSIITADVNGDGALDLMVVNPLSNTVSVLIGNGHGAFGSPVRFATGNGPTSAATADFNGDGHPDLAVSNFGSNTVSILLGDGHGNFGLPHDFATGHGPQSVVAADFDGDGIPDVATANRSAHTVSVFLGAGDGTLKPKSDFTTGVEPFSLITSDVKFHGVSDLVTANFGSNSISALLGQGNGSFERRADFPTGIRPVALATADLNGDGKLDLAVVDSGTNAVSVLLNKTVRPLTFVFPTTHDVIAGENPVIWAAVEGDPVFPDQEVVFETASAEDQPFVFLDREEAPDFGAGSYSTTIDTTEFPPGPLFLRARFAHESTGPVIPLTIHRLPQPACAVLRGEATGGTPTTELPPPVTFDCSASSDVTDVIGEYDFDFGDGTTTTSTSPVVTHSYPRYGLYDFGLTVSTLSRLRAALFQQLILQVGDPPQLKDEPTCGCDQMILRTKKDSFLGDIRRKIIPEPAKGPKLKKAPLGADPEYVTNNFEIVVGLKAGSTPDKCTEGQKVRRTVQPKGVPAEDKKACTKGRDLPECSDDASCDTNTCKGGSQDSASCDPTPAQINNHKEAEPVDACLKGGGKCMANHDGKCTSYPFKGNDRGEDDFRKPYPDDLGVKSHVAGKNPKIVWIDFPGAPPTMTQKTIGHDYKYDADFLSFVQGPTGSCQCHFTVTIDWDDTNKVYRQGGTKITLVNDGLTSNCTQE